MPEKGKVLIIDDDKVLTKIYSQKFISRGFKVAIAYDGLDGLEKTVSEKPDIVILDIMLPKLDGVMLFRKMRAVPETENIAVILLTNVNDDTAIKECFKLGAIDYLVKSEVTPERLARKVEEVIAKEKRE